MYIHYLEFSCAGDSSLLPHSLIYISPDSQVDDIPVSRCEAPNSALRLLSHAFALLALGEADQPVPGAYVRVLLGPA